MHQKINLPALQSLMHAMLLSGATVMALGLFNINLSWPGKLTILAVVVLHNSCTLWQANRNER